MGYNYKKDKFKIVLSTLISHEDSDIYTEFYNFVKNAYKFKPNKITFDFALGNIKAIKNVYWDSNSILIIPSLFHLPSVVLSLKKNF